MSKKRTRYSAEFKSKLLLELLEGGETLNQIASKYEILPKNLMFLEETVFRKYEFGI